MNRRLWVRSSFTDVDLNRMSKYTRGRDFKTHLIEPLMIFFLLTEETFVPDTQPKTGRNM